MLQIRNRALLKARLLTLLPQSHSLFLCPAMPW